MVENSIFEHAHQSITRHTIELLFPGGIWKGKEYFLLSPLRDDARIGSFSINEAGLFFDFASNDCGDFVDLVSRSRNVGKIEAAHLILEASGRTVTNYSVIREEKNLPPSGTGTVSVSIPEEMIECFRPSGAVGTWIYRKEDGSTWCAVARFNEIDGGKKIIPYHYDGKKWKTGNPLKANRFLFNADKFKGNNLPALVVEGEKCASVEVEGFILTTWIGGSHAVEKTDFSSFKDRKVVIWPNADDPGILAAHKVKDFLPHDLTDT